MAQFSYEAVGLDGKIKKEILNPTVWKKPVPFLE